MRSRPHPPRGLRGPEGRRDRAAAAPPAPTAAAHRSRHPLLALRKELGAALSAGHPWIYRDALREGATLTLATGAVVDVVSEGGAFLGRGLYDARSPIAVRLYTRDPAEPLDEGLLSRRLASALSSRRGLLDLGATTAFRLSNGEGDLLPGVVVDVYGPVAVLRLDGEAAATLRPQLLRVLPELLSPLGVATLYERSPGSEGALLSGPPPPEELVVQEHGVPLAVDVVHGQKTGLFLDQRESRLLVQQVCALSPGLSVWNGFCYSGGFSVQAARGGAGGVVSVDVAPGALQSARRNFALSGFDLSRPELAARFPLVCEDVFPHLRRAAAMGLTYDLVIADPPSFAPKEAALPRALAAYRDLFCACARAVRRGGLLAAGSCSSHVTLEAFLRVVGEAAAAAGRPCRVVEVRGQPADHPSPPLFPEGRYLKFVLCRLD